MEAGDTFSAQIERQQDDRPHQAVDGKKASKEAWDEEWEEKEVKPGSKPRHRKQLMLDVSMERRHITDKHVSHRASHVATNQL